MQTIGTATRVTIYIGESDKWGHGPLWSAILEMLRREECAGATVVRGLAGFGAASRIHSASIVALSEDLPLVIQWVDDPARVERVMPKLVEMVAEGLITVEHVEVAAYSHRRLRQLRTGAPVRDIMHREVRSVGPDTPLDAAVELLINQRYRTLPVVDAEHRVVGILTDGDLLNRANLPATTAQEALTENELLGWLNTLRARGRVVREVMTPDPVTVAEDTTIAAAIHVMTERDIKRLPVVDGAHRLIGIVSRVDVLRTLAQPPVREAAERAPQPGKHVRVGEIMITDVPAVPVSAPLPTVLDYLTRTARRRVVVVDDRRHVLGIITDADLLGRASAPERSDLFKILSGQATADRGTLLTLGKRTAGDVMTRNPVTVHPDTPLLEALQLLLRYKVKRLPVVDAEGRLVGLVGRGGILQSMAAEV